MKTILIIILAFSLQGCGFFKKQPEVSPPETKVAQVDPKLLKQCEQIRPVKVAEFIDALQAYSSLASQYVDCANKHTDLVIVTKKLGNIK